MDHLQQPASSHPATPTVLLVDDEMFALEEYQELLELDGVHCEIEVNPLRAISTVLAHPEIRVVVTDLRMPEMNGVELINQLRSQLPPGREVRFIILSGYIEAYADSRSLPDVLLLEKPIEPDVLSQTIRRNLDDKRC